MNKLFCFLLVYVSASGICQTISSPAGSFWTAAHVTHLGENASVSSLDPRPLWMAIDSVGREYGWVIDYEDPIYDIKTETSVYSDPRWESIHPGKIPRLPSGNSFASTYTEVTQPPSSNATSSVLNKIISDYNTTVNPGTFLVRAEEVGRFSVVGYSRSSGSGQASILDHHVNLPHIEQNGLEALISLTQEISAVTGAKVVLGALPYNLLLPNKVDIGGTNIPARTQLMQIADSGNTPLIWDLLFDLNDNCYYLSLAPALKRKGTTGTPTSFTVLKKDSH